MESEVLRLHGKWKHFTTRNGRKAPIMEKGRMSPRKAAEILGVRMEWVYDLIKRHRLPAERTAGGRWEIPVEAVNKRKLWMAASPFRAGPVHLSSTAEDVVSGASPGPQEVVTWPIQNRQ